MGVIVNMRNMRVMEKMNVTKNHVQDLMARDGKIKKKIIEMLSNKKGNKDENKGSGFI